MSDASDKLDQHLQESIAQLTPPQGKPMSVTGFQPGAIRAAIDAAKKKSQDDLAAAMQTLVAAQDHAATVPAAIHDLSAKIKKEADDALQELAQFTNGGPL